MGWLVIEGYDETNSELYLILNDIKYTYFDIGEYIYRRKISFWYNKGYFSRIIKFLKQNNIKYERR